MWQCFTHLKIWNLKFDKFKPNFKTLNDFRCKSDEYKSCLTHQDLQFLFWSSCHLTKFKPFKFEILKNEKFEPKFETQNDLNILFPQVPRHVTSTRCSTFHVSSWIRPQHTPNIMNIIFWITKFHYFMHLQFKFEVCKKNSTKRKKLTKYTQKKSKLSQIWTRSFK